MQLTTFDNVSVMEFLDLIDGLAKRLGHDSFDVQDGTECAVNFDNMPVLFRAYNYLRMVSLRGKIGIVPSEGRSELDSRFVTDAFLSAEGVGPICTRDPEDGCAYVTIFRSLDAVDNDEFYSLTEKFVNDLERLRKMLADFRPTHPPSVPQAQGGADADHESDDNPGMIRV